MEVSWVGEIQGIFIVFGTSHHTFVVGSSREVAIGRMIIQGS